AESPLTEAGLQGRSLALLPFAGGALTLEGISPPRPASTIPRLDDAPTVTLQLTFWAANVPVVPFRSLPAQGGFANLDFAGDGLLVTGGEDHQVRAWKDGRLLWSGGFAPPSTAFPLWGFLGDRFLLVHRRDGNTRGPGGNQIVLHDSRDGRPLREF